MARIFLQDMVEDLKFEELPPNWNTFDLENFSKTKKLWDYQQEALKNAIKVLWQYYEWFVDYEEGERLEINVERKRKFLQWYQNNGLDKKLDIKLDRRKRKIYNLLVEYFSHENDKIPYENFINRMCFWMATGSGKTLVIIKLIQILAELIKRKEVPPYDILILTHRDDLIEQLQRHVNEFNYANETKIILKSLKEYPEVKRQPTLYGITVFYYRSDNLSDEQKEKIVDFKNYDNNGKWYIFLDEAHKGDKEESKRQHIYSILSRNGFLFNSSATFIDPRDIITTVFNFNLEKFINAGYGKHIVILRQEIRAFRDDEDYSDTEKQKIVLKSLILLTYVKKFYDEITKIQPGIYHKPLLLTLVNSVNIEDADLKLFFREIERIGKGDIEEEIFNQALHELWDELKHEPKFMFEKTEKVKIEESIFKSITKGEVLNHVFNAKAYGEIEVLVRPSNRQELAFKLKTSDKPFALVKIGDISEWLKKELRGYEVQERFEDESYFETLNKEDSDINILMGSRSFYEGWDSNRPNIINFINIGMGEDARKFILQSVGRGVRIEPVKDKRRRLRHLYNAGEIDEALFHQIKDKILPLETLFIFGTNRRALEAVMKELEKEKKSIGATQLSLFVNRAAKGYKLLVPTYRKTEVPRLKEKERLRGFPISKEDFGLLNRFIEYIPDDRILLMRYDTEPIKLKVLREIVRSFEYFKEYDKSFRNIDLLVYRILDYFSIIPEEFEKLKELENEIRHFQHVKVYLEDVSEVQRKIEMVKNSLDNRTRIEREISKLSDEMRQKIRNLLLKEASQTYEHKQKKIEIKYVVNHYYIPLILSVDDKVDYIKHVIKTSSEVRFIHDLEHYLENSDNKFNEFDWWMFSKLDESLDEVYIPYYNPTANKISKYYPDFIFWLQKGNKYFIVFVDPKGTEHTDYMRKIDGYKEIFEGKEERSKIFNHNGLNVTIKLYIKVSDTLKVPHKYRQYAIDRIEGMLINLLNE